MKNKIDSLKNFGIESELVVSAIGLNGKLNEVSAAFGLLQLKYIGQAIAKRKKVDEYYRDKLSGFLGIKLIDIPKNSIHNFSYFPILIDENCSISRDALYEHLKSNKVYVRKYFYPLLSDFSIYRNVLNIKKENLIVAKRVTNQVLCLPIYPDLSEDEQASIIDMIRECTS